MTPDDLLHLLPPAWLDWLAAWAPTIVLVLAITSALSHAVLALAPRLEAWARSTEATSDDVAVARLLAVAGYVATASAWLAALLPRLTVGRPAPAPVDRKVEERRRPKTPPDPPPGVGGFVGLLIFAVAASAAHLAVGCSGAAMPLTTVPVTVNCQRIELGDAAGEAVGVVETTSGGEVAEDGTTAATVVHRRGGRGAVVFVDNDCTVHAAPTTSPTTTGNGVETDDVSPQLTTTVSGTGGTAAGAP